MVSDPSRTSAGSDSSAARRTGQAGRGRTHGVDLSQAPRILGPMAGRGDRLHPAGGSMVQEASGRTRSYDEGIASDGRVSAMSLSDALRTARTIHFEQSAFATRR